MESNKDEAVKCLAIAQRHRNAGNLASAKRFCQKSLSLFATAEGDKLLEIIEAELASESSSSFGTSSSSSADSASAFTSSAEAHPSSSGTRHRNTDSSSQTNGQANGSAKASEETKRDYTPEQAAVVKRIRACKVTEYYEILSLKKDCGEAEVKKAYRKVPTFLELL
jgi:DnaJ homolog subfamily B member 12